MSLWRRWHIAAIAEWRQAACPCLLRFADGHQPSEADEWGPKQPMAVSPAKFFPSFWANVRCLSDRERDFFVQCVEHIHYSVGMSITPLVMHTMNRMINGVTCSSSSLDELVGSCSPATPRTICDVVLMPDGRPCIGWFLDQFDFQHYTTIIAALEDRWRVSSGSLWILKERSIVAQLNSMTSGARQDSVFAEYGEWTIERLNSHVSRHVRFADKITPAVEHTVAGMHRLSLSLLDEFTGKKMELLFISVRDQVASEKTPDGATEGYPTLCRSFCCLLRQHIKEFNTVDGRVRALGLAISSVKCDDGIMKVYRQLVEHSLDRVEGRQPPLVTPVNSMMCSFLKKAVCKLLDNLSDVDRLLVWFPRVVMLSLTAPTPKERDDAIRTALLAIPFIDRYMDVSDASTLHRHTSERPRPVDEKFYKSSTMGLVDKVVLDQVLCGTPFAARYAPRTTPENTDIEPHFVRCSGAWMPGVGLDSSYYISNLLTACDALAGMLLVPEILQDVQNESQRAVFSLRQKVRVHVLRRFGFAHASKVWGSALRYRALPFLNALRSSLHPSTNITVFRFRNNQQMPDAFGAVKDPSALLQSLLPEHLVSPGSCPSFYVECGTVQELKAMTSKPGGLRRLRCFFAPNSQEGNIVFEFDADKTIFSALTAAAVSRLNTGPETRFADVAAYVHNGRFVTRLL